MLSTVEQSVRMRRTLGLLVFIVCVSTLFPAAAAPAVYENYTFVTLAGPTEPGAGWFDGVGTEARFSAPGCAVVDRSGNVYVADFENHTVRKMTPDGKVSTLAGLAGVPGSADGTGNDARFFKPQGVAVDDLGNVFVADMYNHAIRKITPDGVVTRVAGKPGIAGTVNGVGSAARFRYPASIAVGPGGMLFVADTYNHTIRKITPAGAVTTFAGAAGTAGVANGTGAAARFNTPLGIAADGYGNLYVADTVNHTIRKIAANASVTTLAGKAGTPGTTDDIGSAARFTYPIGVTCAANGSIYVADAYNHTIRVVGVGGAVTTLAGSPGKAGWNDGTGQQATFQYPSSVALDSVGNVLVADTSNHALRKVSPAGEVTTIAGAAAASGSTDGAAALARFKAPMAAAVDNAGNVYVADYANHTIRRISPDGTVSTIAGYPGVSGSSDGVGADARFKFPTGLGVDTNGNIYVADQQNQTIRKITPAGLVSTVAGAVGVTGSANGPGPQARFNFPMGLAVDLAGNVYVGDTWNHMVRKISPEGVVSTLAGFGKSGFANGVGSAARFSFPIGLAADALGNVYVADEANNMIRKITSAGLVTTLAGHTNGGYADAQGTAARFRFPFALAVDAAGNVFVADYLNSLIRKVTPEGRVTTVGGAVQSHGSIDGSSSDARFNNPEAVAVDRDGNLHVVDTLNHNIRKGYSSLPDRPVVDLAVGALGSARQLDIADVTTTEWSWSIIRAPAGSVSQLSTPTAKTPRFLTDQPGTFIARLRGRNPQGRFAIGTVSMMVDTQPPTLAITTPYSGQRLAGPMATVSGTARDNFAVAKVWCRNNGGAWVEAVGTTNWTAAVSVGAETNLVEVYAIDLSGNTSPVVGVAFYGLVSDRLTLNLEGQGTVTPNLANSFLQVGKTYSLTAAAKTGFAFRQWLSNQGLVSARPTLSFVMHSNLVLTAVFADVARPSVAVQAPTVNQRVPNTSVTVQGTAADNVGVAQVLVRLNQGSWQTAAGTTSWQAATTLVPGNNQLSVCAVDVSGNRSLTNSRTVICAPFSVQQGTYWGLFMPDTDLPIEPGNSGSIVLTVADTGAANGRLVLAGKTNGIATIFDASGNATFQLPAAPSALQVTLSLANGAQGRELIGNVSGAAWSALIQAYPAAPQTVRTGKYTFVLDEGDPMDPAAPAGFGLGTLIVKTAGSVQLAGYLADGTRVTTATALSESGWSPFYIPLQGGQGCWLGWLQAIDSGLQGDANIWIKAPAPASKYYPAGFRAERMVQGSRYLSPGYGRSPLTWTNGIVTLEGGNLVDSVELPVKWANNSFRVVGANAISFTSALNTTNGLLSGTFTHPVSRTKVGYKAAVVPNLDVAAGYFLGPSQSGSVYIYGDPGE